VSSFVLHATEDIWIRLESKFPDAAGLAQARNDSARKHKRLRAFARELNQLNIRTPRGSTWCASTVRTQLTPKEAA
jgi:hypothetical protein